MPAKKKKVTTTDSNQLNEGIFASLVNENKNITTFEDTDAALVKDWLPTLIPSVDSVLLGGFPLSGRVTEIFGQPSVGKGSPKDTLLPTPTGTKKVGDLKVGDTLFDRKGKPTKVLGVYPQGKKEVYEVTLQDGRTVKVNDEHIWSLVTSRGNLVNKTTRELIDGGVVIDKKAPQTSYHYRYHIPTNDWVIYPEKPVSVDPYLLGAFLGDGCLTESQLTISSNDKYVVNKIAKTIGGVTAKNNPDRNYSWVFEYDDKNDSRLEHLRSQVILVQTNDYLGKLSNWHGLTDTYGKGIPEEYLYNSKEVRLALAQGLMDTDGSISGNKGHVAQLRWSSVNEKLAKQFASLLRSLGYQVTFSKYVRDRQEEKRGIETDWTLTIKGNQEQLAKLITLPRHLDKLNQCRHNARSYQSVAITSIKDLGYEDDIICLYVDNDEHLYLVDDYVVTHNTTITHSALAVAQKTGKVIPVIYDIEGTVNKERLRELGVDPSKVITLKPTKNSDGSYTQITVEQVFQHMIDLLASIKAKEDKEIDNGLRNPEDRVTVLFIWDTVAMTLPDIAAKAEVGAQQVGQQARALSDGIRRVNVNLLKNNGALIALNQARDDIGGNAFIKETKTVGGNGWQHELSLRLLMTGGSKEKVNATDKTNIGKTVRLHFKKSKVGNNDGAVAEAVLLKDTGFDIYYNAYLSAKDNKIIEQRGSWFRYITENGESIQKHNADWTAFLKSDEGFPVFTEIWQRLVKLYFPQCYPPLFNSSVVLTEEAFPFLKGLREYYSKIQDKLPMEEQNTNYRVWKRERSETK